MLATSIGLLGMNAVQPFDFGAAKVVPISGR